MGVEQQQQIVSEIALRVHSGELPSVVLRAQIEEHPDLFPARSNRHFMLGQYLREAFDESILLNIVWRWKYSANSEIWDAYFNVLVIGWLQRKGVALKWDADFCESTMERITPAMIAEAEEDLRRRREEMSFELLLERIRSMEGKPVCIQAVWDGDSNGLFVNMSVILRVNGELKENGLGAITFGGDIRSFDGKVSPWPDTKEAKELGGQLAQALNTPFHFPSADVPDSDVSHWVDLVKKYPAYFEDPK